MTEESPTVGTSADLTPEQEYGLFTGQSATLARHICESVDRALAKAFIDGATAVDICTETTLQRDDDPLNYDIHAVRHYISTPMPIEADDYPLDDTHRYRIERYDLTSTTYDAFRAELEDSPLEYDILVRELRAENDGESQ
jgi:hypothetical protein